MISWTSPRASASGLPISRVTSRARASLLSSTSRPRYLIARPRTGAGVAAQPGWASRAARQAATKVAGSASMTSATTWPVWAGSTERQRRPPSARPAPTREASRDVCCVMVQPYYQRRRCGAQPEGPRAAPHRSPRCRGVLLLGGDGYRRPSLLEQAGQAPQPWEARTRSATRICSARLALWAEPVPPLARQVPGANWRPPEKPLPVLVPQLPPDSHWARRSQTPPPTEEVEA